MKWYTLLKNTLLETEIEILPLDGGAATETRQTVIGGKYLISTYYILFKELRHCLKLLFFQYHHLNDHQPLYVM